MKKMFIFLLYCFLGHTGYPETRGINDSVFYNHIPTTCTWTEKQIITLLQKGELVFCKTDLLMERKDTSFYIKNIELSINDPVFQSAYIESSVFYSKRPKKNTMIACVYLVVNDKWGNALQITEDELIELPLLGAYLDKKIQKTHFKKCRNYWN